MKDNLITVGLDIGTTKITTVIAEIGAGGTASSGTVALGTVDIIGEGTVPSEGIKRGAVVNLERTTNAIRASVQAAERVSGVKVTDVYIGVAGNHVKAITSHGLAAIRRNQEIQASDVDRAIENARAVPLDPNLEVIHALPQEYTIDGQEGIKNPAGMQGVRLEVDVHIVSGASGPLANLRRCAQEAGLNVRGFVLQSLASGIGTLDPADQEATVAVIDIGGSSTDLGVFKRGNLVHSASIPIGGDFVTADLAQILKIPIEEAERVKRKYGSALPELADTDLQLEITTGGGQTHAISAFELSRVIKPRIAEIYNMVRDEIDGALGPVELVAGGVVLTGGGSLLRGMTELARERFRLPVRIGRPRGLTGLTDIVSSPTHATAVGLALYAAREGGATAGAARLAPVATPGPDQNGAVRHPTMPDVVAPTVDVAEGKPAKEPKERRTKPAKPHDPDQKSVMDRLRDFFKDWL